jgi:hypothetical protein
MPKHLADEIEECRHPTPRSRRSCAEGRECRHRQAQQPPGRAAQDFSVIRQHDAERATDLLSSHTCSPKFASIRLSGIGRRMGKWRTYMSSMLIFIFDSITYGGHPLRRTARQRCNPLIDKELLPGGVVFPLGGVVTSEPRALLRAAPRARPRERAWPLGQRRSPRLVIPPRRSPASRHPHLKGHDPPAHAHARAAVRPPVPTPLRLSRIASITNDNLLYPS